MEVISYENIGVRLNEFVEQDKQRDNLLRNLVKIIDEKKDQIQQLEYDLEHERESRLRYQLQAHELKEETKRLDAIIKKDPFVTVLIDGDGAIFRNEFFENPAQGAHKASVALQQEIRNYLKKTELDAESVPVLVRIFVNLQGLAGKMRSLGIVESERDMRTFAEYFNKSRAEFDIVDVGSGKENADAKMRKMLAQSIKNFQCKKIFFAGCHDSGYMHDMNEYQGDQAIKDRIVLLETTPAHHSFRALGYELAQFDQTFRSDPLETKLKHNTSPLSPPPPPPPPTTATPATPATPPLPPPPPSSVTSQVAIPVTNHGPSLPNSPQRESAVEARNVISSGNGGHSINYSTTSSAVTYATVGRTNGQQNISLVSKTAKPAKLTINRNGKGQRVDSALQSINNKQVINAYQKKLEAIKPRGFCNDLNFLGKCERPSCKMDHETTLTDQEVAYHYSRARQALCGNGPTCERHACYLSHHCPWDPCSYGSGCKFKTAQYGDLHFEKEDKKIE